MARWTPPAHQPRCAWSSSPWPHPQGRSPSARTCSTGTNALLPLRLGTGSINPEHGVNVDVCCKKIAHRHPRAAAERPCTEWEVSLHPWTCMAPCSRDQTRTQGPRPPPPPTGPHNLYAHSVACRSHPLAAPDVAAGVEVGAVAQPLIRPGVHNLPEVQLVAHHVWLQPAGCHRSSRKMLCIAPIYQATGTSSSSSMQVARE